MKIGLFGMPLHPPARKRAEVYQEDAERVILADKLGFEEVFIGEHISCTTEPIPAPMMFLACCTSPGVTTQASSPVTMGFSVPGFGVCSSAASG